MIPVLGVLRLGVRRGLLPALAMLLSLGGGCSTYSRQIPVRVYDRLVPREGGFHALLLNGGARREINYQSHLTHLRSLVEILREDGLPEENVTIFSGDGPDPTADLATRESLEIPNFWMLPDPLKQALRPSITYVDSQIDGFPLRPARREALRKWFENEGVRLRRGDTLLFYVTDHGEKNNKDLTNNTISLWHESLSVSELRELFEQLDRGVRVIMLMSQCYGGAFAHLIYANGNDDVPSGNICGFFASPADRPAYGCYPENRGKDGVGHSHHLFEAAPLVSRLPEVHRRVLVTDDTPDVPLTSSDFFLTQMLMTAAADSGRDITELVDDLLQEAWQDRSAWEPEIRLLDRIGQRFGTFSPRSLGELEEQAKVLPDFSKRLRTYAERWNESRDALSRDQMRRFLQHHEGWEERLKPEEIEPSDVAERQKLAEELLAEFVPFAESDPEVRERLRSLREKAKEASEAAYRAEVRHAAVLRMRSLLTGIAGRVYLARHATRAEREAFDRLVGCEDFTLSRDAAVASAAELPLPGRFPPLAEEQQLVEAVMPAWMGIRYRPVPDKQREKLGVESGAVAVLTVYPESAAARAGLEVGDIILGPPGEMFEEPHQVREWTMSREIGKPSPLGVLREETLMKLTLVPDPYPLDLPELPGPPKVGSPAPPLKVELFKEEKKLVSEKPRVLYFWATWCLPCKLALPELLAFGQQRSTEVIAITDEDADKLREFFQSFTDPFPETIAIDPLRVTFQSYGVSGTPTFVLVDGEGIVRHYQTGYAPEKGLGIEGWQWQNQLGKGQ